MSTNLKDNHWTKNAACGFDKDFLSFDYEVVQRCKAICALCTVKAECLEWVTEIDGHFVAAGLSRYDRLKKNWKRINEENESNF